MIAFSSRGAVIAGTCWVALSAAAGLATAQQIPDSSYVPRVLKPEYAPDKGPDICVDGAHLNVHTKEGQFLGFSRLARADGFRVRTLDTPPPLRADNLVECGILVIASPRNPATLRSRKRPILEAYTAVEVTAVADWVQRGGSLLLIADHMPVVGSMHNLLDAFGFPAIDGFAQSIDPAVERDPLVFRRSDGTLRAHAITNGRSASERIDSIASFTGAAIRPSADLRSLWELPAGTVVIVPDEPFVFPPTAPRISGQGLSQGAARMYGRGRVVLGAEAGMFTAQREVAKNALIGMNHPLAAQNAQFVLNMLHWLIARDGQ